MDEYYIKEYREKKLNLSEEQVIENNKIKLSSIDKLIESLTCVEKDKEVDKDLTFEFMLTFYSFIKAKEIIEKLKIRYNTYHDHINEENFKDYYINFLSPMRRKVLNLLIIWIKEFFHNFNEEFIQELFEFSRIMFITNENDLATKLLQTLYNRQVFLYFYF
jgi:hypothetical protein